MDEGGAYEALRPRLQALGLDPQRVENVLSTGTPDVWYTHGAIEMKHLNWPVRATTLVKPFFRPGQIPWLYRRWLEGGLSWVMIRLGKDYYLFSGFDVRELAAGLPRAPFIELACWRTTGEDSDWPDLRCWLTGKWDELSEPTSQARAMRLRCNVTLGEMSPQSGLDVGYIHRGETTDAKIAGELIDYWLS